ncbi:precorrin-3B C(17)-methyltransferase [Streptomyces sp. NPDC002265]|uniref:precorrin-3B C(17)-methyltransferase n=1 Tax=Streptomyces sp. NPDC002265 TaxID=3154415 RepID=UPI00332ABF67
MSWKRSRRLTVPVLVLIAVAAASCADPSADPRAGETASAAAEGYCPLPEEDGPTPTPCITFDWNQRVAENHAYRSPMPITSLQKQQGAPRAEALTRALRKLAAKGTTEAALRDAAAGALGLRPAQIEIQGFRFDPLRDVLVGGGQGRVCVNGTIDATGRASAEVVGRTADGTCLPGLGGH